MSKVAICLDVDERYPEALLIETNDGYYTVATEVDSETLERWRQVIAEFEAVQDEMLAVYRQAGGKG